VWIQGVAIRPVPPFAVIGGDVLERVESELSGDEADRRLRVDDAFRRFERTQPVLADAMSALLSKPLDETALALGYFLSVAVWLAFDRVFGLRLGRVGEQSWRAVDESIGLEEELRADRGHEAIEFDDVVLVQQPGVMAFIHEHLEAALDVAARSEDEGRCDVDVDDVHAVYRALLVMVLALSYSVESSEAGLSGEHMA
jgi:hypothetical protein